MNHRLASLVISVVTTILVTCMATNNADNGSSCSEVIGFCQYADGTPAVGATARIIESVLNHDSSATAVPYVRVVRDSAIVDGDGAVRFPRTAVTKVGAVIEVDDTRGSRGLRILSSGTVPNLSVDTITLAPVAWLKGRVLSHYDSVDVPDKYGTGYLRVPSRCAIYAGLLELGRWTTVRDTVFAFDSVPPGSYTLEVRPSWSKYPIWPTLEVGYDTVIELAPASHLILPLRYLDRIVDMPSNSAFVSDTLAVRRILDFNNDPISYRYVADVFKGRVVGLDFHPYRALLGATQHFFKLPDSLTGLDSIKSLSIWGHGIDTLPSWVSQRTNLERIRVIDGTLAWISGDYSRMGRLTSMVLSHNRLSHVPAGLMNAPALQYINIDYNKFCAVSSQEGTWLDILTGAARTYTSNGITKSADWRPWQSCDSAQ